MKKVFSLITLTLLISGSLFWGCKKDQVLVLPENNVSMLKSGVVTQKICDPSYYSLYARNGIEVGTITVLNNDNYLTISITGNNFVSGVQLRVSTDPSMAPKNDQDSPAPGRFNFHSSGNDEFNISLADMFPQPPPGGTFDGKTVYIFAHAVIHGSGPKDRNDNEEINESASHADSPVDLFSSYTVCCQPKGCFAHTASSENLSSGGGSRDIISDEGDVIGTAQYNSGILTFSFYQGWYFSGVQPPMLVLGYELNGTSNELFSGDPGPDYSVSLPSDEDYQYFSIQFNLQYCN